MAQTQSASPEFIDPSRLLAVLDAYKKGDFSQRMPADWIGLPGKVADTLNAIIDQAGDMVGEFSRVAQAAGKQGKIDERIVLPNARGDWGALVNSSNALTNDLVSPMNEMIRVVGAVAEGKLGQTMPMEIDGSRLQGQFLKSAEASSMPTAALAAAPNAEVLPLDRIGPRLAELAG